MYSGNPKIVHVLVGYWRNRVLSGILTFQVYSASLAVLFTFRNDRMPHSASAKRRLRQNVRSRDRNKAMKTEIKTSIRKVLEALSAKDVSAAKNLFKLVAKKADQAATSKTIHKNKAARIKSRLSARIVKTAQSVAS